MHEVFFTIYTGHMRFWDRKAHHWERHVRSSHQLVSSPPPRSSWFLLVWIFNGSSKTHGSVDLRNVSIFWGPGEQVENSIVLVLKICLFCLPRTLANWSNLTNMFQRSWKYFLWCIAVKQFIKLLHADYVHCLITTAYMHIPSIWCPALCFGA